MSQTSRVRLGRASTPWGPWLQGPRARGQAHTSDHLLCTACVLAGERGASVTAPDTDIAPEASFREKVLLFYGAASLILTLNHTCTKAAL